MINRFKCWSDVWYGWLRWAQVPPEKKNGHGDDGNSGDGVDADGKQHINLHVPI